jgi:hypothetical protein
VTHIDRRPTDLGRGLSAASASFAVVLSGYHSWLALGVGAIGFAILVAGLLRGSTSNVTTGSFGLFVSTVTAGATNAPILPTLASVVLVVLAWDSGCTSISLGQQLGRATETKRIELFHGLGTVGTGTVTAGIGYAIYWFVAGGRPVGAVVFLTLGAVLLIATLD